MCDCRMLRLAGARLCGARLPVVAPFTVFQSTGMLMARPVPVQPAADESTIAREGYVALTVIPRVEGGVFEKTKKVSIKLRSRQIGQMIAWRINGGKVLTPLSFTAYAGSVPVTVELKSAAPSADEEPMTQLTLTPKPAAAASSETVPAMSPVSMLLPVGEVKALQVLMEAALPHLYGWTPRLSTVKKSAYSSSGSSAKSPEDFFKQFSGQSGQ